MTEISPRFTYSPEGILELKKTIPTEIKPEHLDKMTAQIVESNDFDLQEDGQDFTVTTNIAEYLGDTTDINQRHRKAKELIDRLEPFTLHDPFSPEDGVFSLDYWGDYGAGGVIYPQMQRWLNADLFDEDLAAETFESMVGPYGKEFYKERKGYRYKKYSNGIEAGVDQMSVNIVIMQGDFRYMKYTDDSENPSLEEGVVKWNWPLLSTIGSCACWGVNGDDRDYLILDNQSLRLYEMKPHNVDSYLQSLSLALGMGRLAYEASKYEGTEDIF